MNFDDLVDHVPQKKGVLHAGFDNDLHGLSMNGNGGDGDQPRMQCCLRDEAWLAILATKIFDIVRDERPTVLDGKGRQLPIFFCQHAQVMDR